MRQEKPNLVSSFSSVTGDLGWPAGNTNPVGFPVARQPSRSFLSFLQNEEAARRGAQPLLKSPPKQSTSSLALTLKHQEEESKSVCSPALVLPEIPAGAAFLRSRVRPVARPGAHCGHKLAGLAAQRAERSQVAKSGSSGAHPARQGSATF